MTNTATTTKRSLPSSSSTPNAKRPRSSNASTSSHHPDEDEEAGDEGDDEIVPVDETALERKARKDARTIRNRESAQRSRNQRKAHLAWLEVRVVELEEENKKLRGGAKDEPVATLQFLPPSASESSSYPSDADLNLTSIFPSLSGGISLAAVAPPPPGVVPVDSDTKPFVLERTPVPSAVDQLRAENAALRARLNLLESLVKQVAAASSLGSVESTPVEPLQSTGAQEPLDWDSVFSQPTVDLSSLTSPADLSAPIPIRQSSPTLYTLPNSLPLAPTDNIQQSSPNSPLACHPAAVATLSVQTERSLQRARTDSGLISDMSTVAWSRAVTEKRLDGVARVLVALAKIRGWIPSSASQTVSSGVWKAGMAKRASRWDRRRTSGSALRRGGMRG